MKEENMLFHDAADFIEELSARLDCAIDDRDAWKPPPEMPAWLEKSKVT